MVKTRVLHFVKKRQIKQFIFQGKSIELELNNKIFPPSNHGSLLINHISIKHNESLIDVGTGSGSIAILAAKLGAKVYATDISNDSIILAKHNAIRNNVKIEFKQGSFFSNYNKKFDVIIANLNQEIVHPNYKKAIGDKLTKTIHGGKFGNEILLDFLDIAKNYMHSKSRLYVAVYSVSNYSVTLKKIIENYDAKLINFEISSTKEFVKDNFEWYDALNKKGIINIFKDNSGEVNANIYMFELSLKKL